MLFRRGWPPLVLLIAAALACTARGAEDARAPLGPPSATAPGTPVVTASLPPQMVRMDIRASRLTIPALGIDAPVQGSRVIPDTSTPPPGCPAPPEGQTTLTVPNEGIATPEESLDGLDNKAWIFGHSRWQNQPGVFGGLVDINVGDELLVDGMDRRTGEQVSRRRFVVNGLYLTDIDSGGKLVAAATPADIPPKPVVILQTSVREDGTGKGWLFDPQTVMAKSRSLVEGDVNDPCKYLLLFVFAVPS